MLILVTGGVRSGKSAYAEGLALGRSAAPLYVATARRWGDDFEDRIKRHQRSRGPEWTTYEAEKYVSQLPLADRVAVIDCVTLWLTNFFLDCDCDVDQSLQAFEQELAALASLSGTFIIVTNEIGMGVHAETDMGRKFTDLQGWANQAIAKVADRVVLLVSGIPVTIKSD
jgi:adenosylcobinamide kinase / adenosylcobinamide-phosphate guanylyltransferase